ncbi:MAG TPA: hypothetical protein VFZ56_01140 [Gemmatimonadaceae bacterium]
MIREALRGERPPLLRLNVRCPGCGSAPAIRVTAATVADCAHLAPDARVATYQCHRRRCGRIYDLTARAYQEAA